MASSDKGGGIEGDGGRKLQGKSVGASISKEKAAAIIQEIILGNILSATIHYEIKLTIVIHNPLNDITIPFEKHGEWTIDLPLDANKDATI